MAFEFLSFFISKITGPSLQLGSHSQLGHRDRSLVRAAELRRCEARDGWWRRHRAQPSAHLGLLGAAWRSQAPGWISMEAVRVIHLGLTEAGLIVFFSLGQRMSALGTVQKIPEVQSLTTIWGELEWFQSTILTGTWDVAGFISTHCDGWLFFAIHARAHCLLSACIMDVPFWFADVKACPWEISAVKTE